MSAKHHHDHGHAHEHNHEQHRHHHDQDQAHGAADACCAAPVYAGPQTELQVQAGQELTRLRIEQMDCPVEEQLIRKKLEGKKHIAALQFNLMQRQLAVVHSEGYQDTLLADLQSIGMQPVVLHVGAMSTELPSESPKKELFMIGASVVLALTAELGVWLAWQAWLVIGLAVLAILLTGGTVYKKGLIALRHRNLNINALMSIAVTGAVLLGEWPEAAMVMSLFALAEYIEARSLDRARRAVDGLLALSPEEIEVLGADGSWQKQAAQSVVSGSLIKVAPGARIGLDGVVEQGTSAVNQATITGESLPVEKSVGDPLYAGTVNGMGELLYRSQGRYDDSLLARIALSVQQAQQSKAPVQRFVDQFSRVYTPIVTLLALALALFGPLVFGGTWLDWMYKALVLLVIACPCALVISTPVAVVSALATAARAGLLVKGGLYLERVRHLDYLAVDKTGTITAGMPRLQAQYVLEGQESESLLDIAYALASRSDHPASVALAQSLPAPSTVLAVSGFNALAGSGVMATLQQSEWRLGKFSWAVADQEQADPLFNQWYADWQQNGASFVFLAKDQQLMAAFAIADHIKVGVARVIADLQQLGVQVEMLSGDNDFAVQHVAAQVGIAEAKGDLMPEGKLRIITQRTQEHRLSGMVGDGINDAPALAQADVSFAMGALGSDMAIETADIAIMNDDLAKIPYAMRLSVALHHILVQNISAALGIKLIFLVLAMIGSATMWMAVFADVGASLLVVLNSLRLLKARPSA